MAPRNVKTKKDFKPFEHDGLVWKPTMVTFKMDGLSNFVLFRLAILTGERGKAGLCEKLVNKLLHKGAEAMLAELEAAETEAKF